MAFREKYFAAMKLAPDLAAAISKALRPSAP